MISDFSLIGVLLLWISPPAEMEELQEADVLWPEEDIPRPLASTAQLAPGHSCNSSLNGASFYAKETAPISIPGAASAVHQYRSWRLEYLTHRDGDDGNGGDAEDDTDGGKMVPPHVLAARRFSGKMAFSVCTGQGRTLKGRDLSQVRNSILRLTGFLEG